LIHADRSTGSYAAASAVRAKALSVSPAHGGIHDVYVLFRGHELNFGGLELTLRLAEQPPPKPAHDGVPPVQPHTTAPKTQTPKSRTREIRLRLVQGEQVYPQIAWPDNPRAEVRWASSRKSVASVTNEGKITALSPGSTDVTVKSQASLATFHVTVIAKRGR
jgi:hypothetical protein